MAKLIVRTAFSIVGSCIAAVAAMQLATAAESYNSARSNKSQNRVRPLYTDILSASGIQVTLTQQLAAVGQKAGFRATQSTSAGKATFANVPDGSFAVSMSPATGPGGTVGGLSVASPTSAKVSLKCDAAARADNTYNCSITLGGGPATLTLTLLNP